MDGLPTITFKCKLLCTERFTLIAAVSGCAGFDARHTPEELEKPLVYCEEKG